MMGTAKRMGINEICADKIVTFENNERISIGACTCSNHNVGYVYLSRIRRNGEVVGIIARCFYDSNLSGIVKVVSVTGLPEAVGDTYKGKTLFTVDDEGKYVANYEESMDVLEYLFPKDKTIFLMCGGGGYAGMTKTMLVSLGWDANKIYNTGGYWYYEGENNVIVKNDSHKEVTYDFWKVAYHDIDFEQLHEVK